VDDRARLFVAALPSTEVCELLAALPRPAIAGVRYTTREQWHVTLRFLGDASVRESLAAFERVAFTAVDAVVGPAVARLGKAVVIAPVHGLDSVASAVAGTMNDVGDPPDYEGFTGHLTLARLKTRARPAMLGAPIEASFVVHEVHLVRSHLSAQGARYETLATSSAS
jgi:RNA 2',3'-cyclic 3'-phosphodiesterase